MPDILDENGLQVKTATEILDELTTDLKLVYGDDINLDSNSPDGNILNIITQAATDIRELHIEVYNSMDPDKATGQPLRSRCAINNIDESGGTFTIQPIDIIVDREITLSGLDSDYDNLDGTGHTVQDNAGNQFILIDTATLEAGTTTLSFRAKSIGKIETVVNTITNPVTVELGVISVNNSQGALEIGTDAETDEDLRLKREKSVALASNGYLNGLQADLLNLDGVSEAFVFENVTDAVDADGIPAHGIWAIVEGGANTDIANTIYSNHSYGDMKGSVSVPVKTPAGAYFTAKFDRSVAKPLYIKFGIQPTISGITYDLPTIENYIVNNLSYKISDYAETSNITDIAKAAISNSAGSGIPVNVQISKDGASWTSYLKTDFKNEQWTVSADKINITVIT